MGRHRTERLRSILSRLWWIETSRSDQVDRHDRRLQWTVEAAIIAVIAASGLIFGGSTYRTNFASAEFYQSYFGPALNLACNGTFNEIQASPAVQDFLALKSRTLGNCEGVQDLPTRKIGALQASMRYLELISAGAWKMLGVSWENLYVIAALLTAGLALSSYLLFRVFCESRLAAAIGTFLFISSTPVLDQLPNLRDFSKSPFLVAALACLAAATIRSRRPIMVLLLAAASGSLVSIGLGFRPDVTVVFPIALVAPILFIGRGKWRCALVLAIAAWAGFAGGYIALRLPLLLVAGQTGSEQGSLLPHVFILGFAEQFLRDQLGMSDASYSVFRPYMDWAVFGASTLFAGTPAIDPIPWASTRYGEVSGDLLRSIFLLTPQDAFFRVFYTFNAIGHLPLLWQIWGKPLLLLTPLFLFYRLREFLFILLSFTVLASVLSLQFDIRHAFYIPVLGAAVMLMAASAGWSVVRKVRRSGFLLPPHAASITVGFASAVLIIIGSGAALTEFLGAIQRDALARLAQTFSNLEWQSIAYRHTQDGIEPQFSKSRGEAANSFVLKRGIDESSTAEAAFSRLTIKVQPVDVGEQRLPLKLTWAASQEKVAIPNESFQFSTRKPGYAVESGPISGADITSPLTEKGLPPRVLVRIKGETLGGAFAVGILNKTKTGFAFTERLPYGTWEYARSFVITPDLSSFTILFINPRGRSTIRIDAIGLFVPPTSGCWSPGAAVTSRYLYVDNIVNLGGFRLQDRAGIATYYFPQTFTKTLSFSDLDLGGISPDCVLDWSIAKSFPARTVPAEVLLMDGKLDTPRRGDWGTVWRNFN